MNTLREVDGPSRKVWEGPANGADSRIVISTKDHQEVSHDSPIDEDESSPVFETLRRSPDHFWGFNPIGNSSDCTSSKCA
jgi:hypothetical protein